MGVLWPAGGAADVESNEINEISDPNNPKLDTHIDTFVISFEL